MQILHQCGKRVKTKSQNVLWATSYVCRNYMGKTGGGGCFLLPPILNRVNDFIHSCPNINLLILPLRITLNNCFASGLESYSYKDIVTSPLISEIHLF